MTWVVWRQHRTEALATLGVLLVGGLFLLLTGRAMADTFQHSGLSTCLAQHPAVSSPCGALGMLFLNQYGPFIPFAAALLLLPPLLGALVGAPLLAREYEQRTHLLVWMQSVPRSHWLAVHLGAVLGAGLLVGGALLAMLARWYSPFDQIFGKFNPVAFDFTGPVFVAATVMALAVGIAAGAVTGRTVSAIFVTLGLLVAIHVIVEFNLRPNYAPQIVVTWPLEQDNAPVTLTKEDWNVASGLLDPQGNRVNGIRCNLTGANDPFKCAKTEGYRGHYLAYQPASRFWPFQWIETGIYLAISVMTVALTTWLVRRRVG
jgi:hypothetical protein